MQYDTVYLAYENIATNHQSLGTCTICVSFHFELTALGSRHLQASSLGLLTLPNTPFSIGTAIRLPLVCVGFSLLSAVAHFILTGATPFTDTCPAIKHGNVAIQESEDIIQYVSLHGARRFSLQVDHFAPAGEDLS